jgi:hypothetical protein
VQNVYPNLMANNTLKYRRLVLAQREQAQEQWNQPMLWPLWASVLLLLTGGALILRRYRQEMWE